MSNIRTSQIIKALHSKYCLLCAGIMLALLVAWLIVYSYMSHHYHFTPEPTPPFHVEGYPIKNLPASVKLMKYVATFNMDGMGMDLLPTSTGFLTREGNTYLMHDWRNGHCRWRVNIIPGSGGWGQPHSSWPEINNSSFALSDDGRYFTASTVEKHGVRIRRWHNGKMDGDCTVLASTGTPPKPGYYQLAITSNGRILLDYYYDGGKTPPEYLLALDGHRVITSAKLPGQARILPGGTMAYDSEQQILYTIQESNGHIRFNPIAHKFPEDFLQCTSNYLLASNGAVYTPSGNKLPSTSRRQTSGDDNLVKSDLISKIWLTDQVVFSQAGNRHEVFCLSSQTHWSFTTIPGMDEGVASAHGRYVLIHGKSDIKDGPNDNMGMFVSGTDAVWLYERPGTLRAALRFAADRVDPPENNDGGRIFSANCVKWILSPDGHTVILMYQYMGLGGIALLYCW